LITVNRTKTDRPHKVGISPELAQVLDELKTEYRHMPNMAKLVFTKDAKPIRDATLRHAFDRAMKRAGMEGFLLKDFRHVARTRWSLMGLPVEVAEIGLGYSLKGLAKVYNNPTDDQLRQAWQKLFTTCRQGISTSEKSLENVG